MKHIFISNLQARPWYQGRHHRTTRYSAKSFLVFYEAHRKGWESFLHPFLKKGAYVMKEEGTISCVVTIFFLIKFLSVCRYYQFVINLYSKIFMNWHKIIIIDCFAGVTGTSLCSWSSEYYNSNSISINNNEQS